MWQVTRHLTNASQQCRVSLFCINKCEVTKFLIAAIELGLIRFLYEYHDHKEAAISIKHAMGKIISDKSKRILYMQLNKQKISLGSASGSNFGVCTHFTPNVYEWFYDSLSTTATALNISISDLCYCCWCITMQNCMPNNAIDKMTAEDVSDILAGFEVEIKIQSQRIEQLLSNIKDGV